MAYFERFIQWVLALGSTFLTFLGDPGFRLALILLLATGGLCLVVGIWLSRRLGILEESAPPGDRVGVGLGCGLFALISVWATFRSAGHSAFTPLGIAFVGCFVVAVRRRWVERKATTSASGTPDPIDAPAPNRRPMIRAVTAATFLAIIVGFVYSTTLVPRNESRDVIDQAYWATLGPHLAETGLESKTYPNLRSDAPFFQTWYHWGEPWLASVGVQVAHLDPGFALNLLALPLCITAAAALAGSVTRRLVRRKSRWVFLSGAAALLLLMPIPAPPGISGVGRPLPFLRGPLVTVSAGAANSYVLGAVGLLLVVWLIVSLVPQQRPWGGALLAGTLIACLIPSQSLIFGLMVIGAGAVLLLALVRSTRAGKGFPAIAPVWRKTLGVATLLSLVTVVWGLATHHVVTTSHQDGYFDWVQTVAEYLILGGILYAVPVAWFVERKKRDVRTNLLFAASILPLVGAALWGLEYKSFDSVHFFWVTVPVFLAPATAVAVWTLVESLRRAGRGRIAALLLAVFWIQVVLGGMYGIARIANTQRAAYPQGVIAAIRALPAGSVVAYSCQPGTFKATYWHLPDLLGVDALTDRRVMELCPAYSVIDSSIDAEIFPEGKSLPPAELGEALKSRGVHYIYADQQHPNTLVPDAVPIARSGDTVLLHIP